LSAKLSLPEKKFFLIISKNKHMIPVLLRVFAVPFLCLCYIVYQLFNKNRDREALKTDILYAVFISTVYFGLYYFFIY